MLFKKLLSYLLTFSAVIFIGWFTWVKLSAADSGEKAPDFSAELINGETFTLSEQEGTYVLLNFWASWCGSCRRDNRELVKFYNSNRGRLIVVSVAIDSNEENWKNAIAKDGLNWNNHIISGTNYPLFSDIAQQYGVTSIPTKFLISPDGVLLGEKSWNEIDRLINE